MDLGLTETQELLKNAAREFLEHECPESHVREMEEDERGYSEALWAKMAEQGWQGLLIPEAYGGAGRIREPLAKLRAGDACPRCPKAPPTTASASPGGSSPRTTR